MGQKRLGLLAMAILQALAVGTADAQHGSDAETQVRIAKAANDSLDAQLQEVSTFATFAFGAAAVAGVVVAVFAFVAIGARHVRSQSTSNAIN
jgi:hypothetical protein